ncbi:MAG: PQQ-dependent sugar dehydrogenase, partial [Leptolyngbyaceae cyanobacterium]
MAGSMLISCATTAPEQSATQPATSTEAVSPGSSNQAIAQTDTLQQTTLAEPLEHPWGMDWLPDGTLMVTERPGRVRLIRNGVIAPTPVAGVPDVFAGGQGGLMDVSVHPQFAENQCVYFTYAAGSSGANQSQVARAQFDGSTLSDWTVILDV